MVAVLLFLLELLLVTPVSTASHAPSATVSPSHHVPAVAPPRHPSALRPGLRGADISWPNCPKGEGIPSRRSKGEPLPGRRAAFVVVGLTNGPGFYPNPCLAQQVRWVHRHHRLLAGYAMTTYPSPRQIQANRASGPYDAATASGVLRNAGYAEAAYNVQLMRGLHMAVPMVWVDVEPYPTSPWSRSHHANRQIVRGAIRSYRDAGYRVGIYTYANGWAQVVGSWRRPALPTWTTAGHGGATQARAMCHRGPSGGVTWLSQWYTVHRDFDLTCPAAPGRTQLFAPRR